MAAVAAEVADGNILNLIEKFLRAGVLENGVFKPTTVGTPQGGVISPLLANIALNYLDWQLAAAGFRFVRYADDFVVLCRSAVRAQEARRFVERILRDELGLTLSPDKTMVTKTAEGFSFLGFTIARSVRIREKSLRKFQEKIRDLTRRHFNLDAELLRKLNAVIRGTARYFATPFTRCRKQFEGLDEWIRMRLRCMKYGRKSREDNRRLSCRTLARMGLISMWEIACSV